MNQHEELSAYARSFLLYYEHPSQRAETKRAMILMYDYLKRHFEAQEAPPTLGVGVTDSIATQERIGG